MGIALPCARGTMFFHSIPLLFFTLMQAAVGFSQGADANAVGYEAAQRALEQLGSAEPHLALLFSSVRYHPHDVAAGARTALRSDIPLVGATTAGEIVSEGPLGHHSVVIALLSLPGISIGVGVGENLSADSHSAGRLSAEAAVRAANAPAQEVSAGLVFFDGLRGNGSAAVRGVEEVLGSQATIVGGAAGDDAAYQQTFQFGGSEVLTDAVVCAALSGDVALGVGVNHGWSAVSGEHIVTKAEGSILREVDGKPAIALYEDYLGKEWVAMMRGEVLARLALSYPLGIVGERLGEEYLLRAPFFVNNDGSIVLGGAIQEGDRVVVMVGDKTSAIEAARRAGRRAKAALGGREPRLILIFSCHVRDKLYLERTEGAKEVVAIREELGDAPVAGFYTYGEIAPLPYVGVSEGVDVSKICRAEVHNETVVVCALG